MATSRSLCLIAFWIFFVPPNAQVLAPRTGLVNAQNSAPVTGSSEERPQNSVHQNAPCVGQPKSLKDLTTAFQTGQLPLSSELTGTWVEIGWVVKDRYHNSQNLSLNCSGLKRESKFEFVLVANGYSIELHAIGMTYPQKVIVQPNHEGSIEFPVDFAADEGPDSYRCRLTKRGTLVCLVDTYEGEEFKKMTVEKEQIHEVTEVP